MAKERAGQKVVRLDDEGHVFRNANGSAPFKYRAAGDCSDGGEGRRFRVHDLRHLAASTLAMAGASQRELQEVLGHDSPAMSSRYSHFFDKNIADLGDKIAGRLFGKTNA